MGALIPEKTDGLIVCEKGISVTNIVNGTTRLQPVVLLTGQAAGMLAAKSILLKKKVRDVPVRSVQEELLKAKCYLMPFSDVKQDDPAWEAIQRVGLTGILEGVGKSEGWENKMYFYPDSLVSGWESLSGMRRYAGFAHFRTGRPWYPQLRKISDCFGVLKRFRLYYMKDEFRKLKVVDELKNYWEAWGLKDFNIDRLVTRKEFAVMLDKCILLFGSKNLPMDINGKMGFVYSQF
jgi:hypothetical protein